MSAPTGVRGIGWLRPLVAASALLGAGAAARAEGEGAGASPYGDLGQAFITLAIFGGLLWILGKYAWKPVIGQLQRREKEIGERIADSERRSREAKELEAHYRERLDRAEAEARQVLAKSLEEASRAREEMLLAAREEGNKALETAREEIEQFKRAALEELQRATARLAVDIASEIIRDELSPEKQQELMDESLARIRGGAGRSAT